MKKILIVLLALAMSIMSIGLFGCDSNNQNRENPNELSLLKNVADSDEWVDLNLKDTDENNENRGLNSFTFSEGDNAFSPLKVHKNNSTDGIKKSLKGLDLKDYKKIIITAKGEGNLTLKLDSMPIMIGGEKETPSSIIFGLSEEPATYEFDLSFEGYDKVRAGLKSISLFPSNGRWDFKENIYISKLAFSKEDVDKSKVKNTKALRLESPNAYEEGDTFDINKNFETTEADAYTILEENGKITITATKNKVEWSNVYTKISGNLKSFKSIYIKYKGTNDISFKVKLEGAGITAVETTSDASNTSRDPDPKCNGEEQEFTWTKIGAENLTAGDPVKFLIFVVPGKKITENVTLEILQIEFRK